MSDVVVLPASRDVVAFSYAELEPHVAAVARAAEAAVRPLQRRVKEDIAQIGQHLLAAKAALPHGKFTAWAESELGINPRTGSDYMALAGWLPGKSATVAGLPLAVVYMLASPKTPSEVVTETIAEAEAGLPVTRVLLKDKLSTFQMQKSELHRAQLRNPKLTAAELKTRKLKKRAQEAAEQKKAQAERDRVDAERPARLLPLAQLIASLGIETAFALFTAVEDYRDQMVLRDLVQEKLGGKLPHRRAVIL